MKKVQVVISIKLITFAKAKTTGETVSKWASKL